MVTYIITIAISALFAALAQTARFREKRIGGLLRRNTSRTTKALLLASLIPLIFTAGFRYSVGSDFGAYYHALEHFNGNPWKELLTFSEPGITVLTKLLGLLTDDGAVFIFTFSFLTIFFSGIAIYRSTNYYLFAILIYIFSGLWHGSFNGVRQFLAATVLLYSFPFIINKKFWLFALMVFIASLFHVSAICMIVLYFIVNGKLCLRNILILIVGTIILSKSYDAIFSFIGLLKDKEMILNTYATNSVSVFRVLVNCAPAILVLALYWNKKPNKKQTFYINGLIVNAAAMLAASNSAYLSRIGIYTGLFVPVGLAELVHLKWPTLEQYLRVFIVLLYAVFWAIDVTGSEALRNFQWVWSR